MTGPKSTEKDEVDEIYKKEDPIESSLGIRKAKNNNYMTACKIDSKQGKFFFTLKLTGGEVPITRTQLMNNAKEEGRID